MRTRPDAVVRVGLSALMLLLWGAAVRAQEVRPAPDRPAGEGEGPFQRLVIRSALLIDGTGAPPRGPVDIVIEGNRIAAIQNAGTPGVPADPNRRRTPADRDGCRT